MKWRPRAGFAPLRRSHRAEHGDATPYYPEGGWGYVVVLAAFTALMVQMGLIVSMGVYLEHIEHEFQSGAGLCGWISSGCFAVLAFASPLASHVMRRLGCRLTAMIGGVVMCVGFVCGTYARSVVELFIFADVIAGIGASMSHISATVVIGQYFNKRYALANGFAYTGQGVGIFIFPPILEALIQLYGWRGCLLVQGALSLHISLAASLYRAVQIPAANRQQNRLNGKDASDDSSLSQGIAPFRSHKEKMQNQNQNNGSDSASCSSASEHAQFSDDSGMDSTAVSASEFASLKSSVSTGSAISMPLSTLSGQCHEFIYEERLGFLEHSKFLDNCSMDSTVVGSSISSGSTLSLPCVDVHSHASRLADGRLNVYEDKLEALEHAQFSDDSGMNSRAASTSQIGSSASSLQNSSSSSLVHDGMHAHTTRMNQSKSNGSDRSDEEELSFLGSEDEPKHSNGRSRSTACHLIRDNPSIHFVFAIFLFETFGYSGYFSHVVARAGEMGVMESQATIVLSIFGIGSLVGRATNGWIVDRGYLTAKILNVLALVIAGGASAMTSMVVSQPGLLAGSFFSGVGSGWYMPLQQVLLRDIVGQSKLHLAYGYGLIFEGAGSLSGGFFIGYLRDISGSYDISFYFLGMVFILGASVFALDHICERRGLCLSKRRADRLTGSVTAKERVIVIGEYSNDDATPV